MFSLEKAVRPLVTLAFAACLIYMALTGKISADFINGICASTITWWYAERSTLKQPGSDK
jgi:hypothetical protein